MDIKKTTKQNKEIILVWDKVKFYSNKDEEIFFEWVKKINCIEKFLFIKKNKLEFYISRKSLPNAELRDLIGLFRRYKIDMKQLKIFLHSRNKVWFLEWDEVFGE